MTDFTKKNFVSCELVQHLVHESEVEERGEDGAEAGHRGRPDQVEDGVEAGEGDGQQQDGAGQAAPEGHALPAEGWRGYGKVGKIPTCGEVQEALKELDGGVEDDGEGGDQV